MPKTVQPVGLFVNHAVAQIAEACEQCGIRNVQLHGDEPPQFLANLLTQQAGIRIIKAHRLGPEGLDPLAEYVQQCAALKVELSACLIDAQVDGAYGGTGTTVPWDLLNKQYRHNDWPPLILAGGLNPENVADAIRAVQPWGVDVSSGVESTPANKDIRLVAQFIEAARSAFDEIGAGEHKSLDPVADI